MLHAACLAGLLLGPQATPDHDLPKGIVATVDGLPITREEANERADRLIAASFQGKPIPERFRPQLRKGILDRAIDELIDERLLDADVVRAGIELEDADVRAALERNLRNQRLVRNRPAELSPEELEAEYGRPYEQYVAERMADPALRRALEHAALLEHRFPEETAVTDEDVRARYDEDPSVWSKPERVRASHILIQKERPMSDAERAAARAEAEEIARLARAEDADFAALAREHSQGPTGPKGGELGVFPRHGAMVEPFAEAAFELPVGGVSDVVETKFGWHVIHVTERLPAYQLEFDIVADAIRETLEGERLRDVGARHLETLREGATIVRRF